MKNNTFKNYIFSPISISRRPKRQKTICPDDEFTNLQHILWKDGERYHKNQR